MKKMIWGYTNTTVRLTKGDDVTVAFTELDTKALIVIKNDERCSITVVDQLTDYRFITTELGWVSQSATLDIVAKHSALNMFPASTLLATNYMRDHGIDIKTSKGKKYSHDYKPVVLLGSVGIKISPSASNVFIKVKKPVAIIQPGAPSWCYRQIDMEGFNKIARKASDALAYNLVLSTVEGLGKMLEELMSNLLINRVPKILYSNGCYHSSESLLSMPENVKRLFSASSPEAINGCLALFEEPAIDNGIDRNRLISQSVARIKMCSSIKGIKF